MNLSFALRGGACLDVAAAPDMARDEVAHATLAQVAVTGLDVSTLVTAARRLVLKTLERAALKLPRRSTSCTSSQTRTGRVSSARPGRGLHLMLRPQLVVLLPVIV